MKLTDNGGKEFEQPPIGNHIARCVGLIDLGTQQGDYQGKTTHARKIILRWELPNELISEGEWAGKPFMVSQFYTASLSEKANLRKVLESWRGRPFTPEELMGFESKNLLDKPCMLNVTHTDKGKAKVASVAQVPKGMTVPGRVNDLLYFSLDDFNSSVYEKLPQFFKDMIQKSPEWEELHATASSSPRAPAGKFDDFADDIPF